MPAKLRKRFGIEEGSLVTAEEREDGILIRPAVVVPVEKYSPERKAEFMLSNATSDADYRRARKEVQKLGLDPDSIPHRRPAQIDRWFLDANVLFSAAYRSEAGLLRAVPRRRVVAGTAAADAVFDARRAFVDGRDGLQPAVPLVLWG